MYNPNIKLFIFISLLHFAVSCAAQATNEVIIEKTKTLVQNGQYQAAYDILKPLADSGDVDANYELGMLYYSSNSKNEYHDLVKAKNALLFAANKGSADAQVGVGVVIQKQVLFERNDQILDAAYNEACLWFKKAALQNIRLSMIETAKCYRDGLFNGHKDYIKAYTWFILASNQLKNSEDPYSPGSMASEFMKRTAEEGKLTPEQLRQATTDAVDIKQNKIVYTRQ